MLKKRLLTALFLIPLMVYFVLTFSPILFCIFTGIIVLWGAWEWSLFLGAIRFPHCFIYPVVMFLLLLIFLFLPAPYLLLSAVIGWLIASLLIFLYPKGRSLWGKSIFWRGLMGVFVLIPCWLAVNMVHTLEGGPAILLFLFALIWGADSAAYFVGKKWGRHLLLPQVSPGKSWEGVLGAVIITLLVVWAVLKGFHIPSEQQPWVLLLSLMTVIFSVIGDLFESMLKRNVDLKDSGQLLPGHGGLLDRIDSLTAAAPVFAVGILWMGRVFH